MTILRLYRQAMQLCFAFALLLAPGWQGAPAAGAMDLPETGSAAGFHLSGRYIHDANGTNFILRGVNHPHTWFLDKTSAFAHIKGKRANAVRVVLSTGDRPEPDWLRNSAAEVKNVIDICKANRLICVLEVHDTTGYGEQAGAASLVQAVAYWKEIQSVLTGQEAYVILNLGNEPRGHTSVGSWVNETKAAIVEMRNAGFQHMLMVDAPNWGQDDAFVMRDNAASVLASDPQGNTVFSIHMFGVFNTAEKIEEYIVSFVNAGLPLVIGEFASTHPDGNPDEESIFSLAEKYGIGYLGWSWSENCCGAAAQALDMVIDFNPNQMTDWGRRIFEGPNGIFATACEASVYGHHCFDDVAVNYWAWNYIERLYQAKITGGCGTNPRRYCPEGTVTRDQMAVFLLRGKYGPTYAPPPVGDDTGFLDVPTTYWAAAWIKQLAAEGITSGCGGGNYCPAGAVTRAQMAVFLLRAKYGSSYSPPAVGVTTGFSDVPTDHWAAAWIKQLAAEGITGGCGTVTYCPDTSVTRAQMAVFLVRTFNLPALP